MNCKAIQNELPNLLLDPVAVSNPVIVAHLSACVPCNREFLELKSAFALLDEWTVPEPTPYFDQKLAVLLREEQAAPPMNWFERLQARIAFNSSRQLRPILTGALATLLLLGGGTYAGVRAFIQPPPVEAAGAVVKDLQILDRNDQTFEQMDQLLQDDEAPQSQDAQPAAPPIS